MRFLGGTLWAIAVVMLMTGCEKQQKVALGTLEWDRIAVPAPAAEVIESIYVREGEQVVRGQLLMQLDPRHTEAQLAAAEAEVARQLAALEELQAGPRVEEIARAEASLEAARAEARDREADFRRLQALGKKDYVSKSDIDAARASAESAEAEVRSAREQLLELQRGYRVEDIAQGRAALLQARADAQAQRVLLDKLTLHAPRDGLIDDIPFKLGDQAPVGASLIVMLTGETPYARVYVPQPLRQSVQRGQEVSIALDGDARRYQGRVRSVRNEPSFTPYYALTGDDVARLSYVAEIQLQQDAQTLPAGLPLKAFLDDTATAALKGEAVSPRGGAGAAENAADSDPDTASDSAEDAPGDRDDAK